MSRSVHVALVISIALMTGSGCASWRSDGQLGSTSASSSGNDDNLLQDGVRGLSDASMHDWNFNRSSL